jgi:hypothetical protein
MFGKISTVKLLPENLFQYWKQVENHLETRVEKTHLINYICNSESDFLEGELMSNPEKNKNKVIAYLFGGE